MLYPAAVQHHFDHPANVGPLPLAGRRVFRGASGTAATGTWIVIEVDVADGCISRVAFQAFGCPYTLASCSLATQQLRGQPVAALAQVDPQAIARELDVPAQRLGRLLVLQDALRNCFRDWDTTQPAAAP